MASVRTRVANMGSVEITLSISSIVVLGLLGTVLWAVLEYRVRAVELDAASDSSTSDAESGAVTPVQ